MYFTLAYLSAIHMRAYIYICMCACRVPFNTNTLAERAAAASSLAALLLVCLLRLSNFFFSLYYTHTNRGAILMVLFFFLLLPYVNNIYCTFVYLCWIITISWCLICLLFPNMRWASDTHMHILSHTHIHTDTTWNLDGGETSVTLWNRCNLLHYTCNTRVQHFLFLFMLALFVNK